MTFTIDIQPLGRRVSCERGETLLQVAQRSGIVLNAICGGEGICNTCLVKLMVGEASRPTLVESAELGDERLKEGWRLACQMEALGDLRVHIPPESLATAQRTQTEGRDLPVELAPAVRAVAVELPAPTLADLRSDSQRLRAGLELPGLNVPLSVLRSLPEELRADGFNLSVFVRGSSLVAARPQGTTPLGLAVDLGTTKLAGYLVDLSDGKTLVSAGTVNPQIPFGEDVMARISHTMRAPDGGSQLQGVITEAVARLADELCKASGRSTRDIADAVVVGNTAMHHLFLGLPVRQLGLAPYVPVESSAMDVPAGGLGFEFCPGASIHLLPNIAGFVGADHVAMLLGSGMLEHGGTVLGMDIGTNTEISLVVKGRHFTCSTASGPAFEGAHIRHGMRAAPGAIEKVLIHEGKIFSRTIDDQPAVGLCGSGILDLVAQLLKAGIIDRRGAFQTPDGDPRVRRGERGWEFVLVRADENQGREIAFDRKDINEIQLAKGAMRTGVQILLNKAGIQEQEIDTVFIAGAFGTYLDVQSGIDIGMFPHIPIERFVQVGNAAGTGARLALLSTAKREQAVQVAKQAAYVELTVEPSFSSTFTKCLFLE
jgi:uncharacterized 2Fe-2S/4Fe-4S cluster protein (DUF4445 family)